MTRLFGNTNDKLTHNGSIEQNGVGKFNDFTDKALKEIKKLGTTHVWYTGVIEHATQTDYTKYGIRKDTPKIVKGKAGSPYAIKDYYDVDPDLATDVDNRMSEFEDMIARTHKAGLKAIIDFVPNHVARQYHSDKCPSYATNFGTDDNKNLSFSPNNNFYYIGNESFSTKYISTIDGEVDYKEQPAKATGNDCFTSSPSVNDWYETVKLNYGVDYLSGREKHFSPTPDTWNKMLHILLYWAGKNIDGFRCDMAEMTPVEFWAWAIPQVKEQFPDVLFIAEVYNPQEYHNYIHIGKFDYLYDKVGLYDTLKDIICFRESATAITNCWQSLGGIEQRMLYFLENHDEQRIASNFFAVNPQRAIPALAVSALMNTNPMMIYFGQEFGERGMDNEGFSGTDGRTTIFDYWSVDTVRRWINGGEYDDKLLTKEEKQLYKQYKKILSIARKEKSISDGLFFDLMYVNKGGNHFDEHRQYAFLRKYDNTLLVVAVNFSDDDKELHINIPSHAFDYMKMQPIEQIEAKDLISGKKENVSLLPYSPLITTIKAQNVKVIKIEL